MIALVIDDSKAMRMFLNRYLTDSGYEVVEAATGGEALLEFARNPTIALALVDWNLPEISGLEIVRAVRAIDRFAQTKIMMVTSESEPSRITSAMNAGANEYLMKPFTSEDLTNKLDLLGLVPQHRH